ncbi:chondroitinase-B domain-containing protein [Colwellia maritima]|uniref:chondroitinase-B domain-containing protein n=1 Tax=Colwellia maritima TaxID=2912588 RepID=UPI00237A0FA5|nr:chondroitinase-B domain-containing protein [Colwellia maritima]
MSKDTKLHFYPLVLFFALFSFSQVSNAKLVRTIEQFDNAIASIKPGEEVVLANGTWNDVELVFKAKGLLKKPITLKAETLW